MNHPILKSSILMLVFTAISIFFVAGTNQNTIDKIQSNEKEYLLSQLNQLVPNYENDILGDAYTKNVNLYGVEQNLTIYPAKKSNKINAFIIDHFYPKGYSGKIRLISAISSDKKFIGMRVISHKETPGLGDGIDVRKSNWIQQFNNLPINQFDFNQWKLKEDGGQFDSMTGATITSEALVNASSELISLFENNEIK
jgi:electron transport complex protein RnfG